MFDSQASSDSPWNEIKKLNQIQIFLSVMREPVAKERKENIPVLL